MKYNLAQIARQFRIDGDLLSAESYGTGHINDTFLVTCKQGGRTIRYSFQRINHSIFKDPPSLMDNIIRVTDHIRNKHKQANKMDILRRALTVILTQEGAGYYRDAEGSYWRAYLFIEGVRTYDVLESPDMAYRAAKAFGEFQGYLSDLPQPALAETIPDFHNTQKRYKTFLEVLEKDRCNRAASAKAEIDFLNANAGIIDVLPGLVKGGQIPVRTTHNDTKINNVLFDTDTHEGICVIDLDTVMPGLSLYDFGDMVRTATCKAAEDERDLSKIEMDITFFEQIARGYAMEAADFLTDAEKQHLVFAGKLITFEQMIRFLTDHLEGDVYYKIHRPGHNLDRTRTQKKLVVSIQKQEERMNKLTETIWKTIR